MAARYPRPLRQQEQGAVLLLAIVTILLIVGMLALAVDVGYLMSGRGQLQNSVDAAALAGAQGLRVAIEEQGSTIQQQDLVRRLATSYANLNAVRKIGASTDLTNEFTTTIFSPSDYPARQPTVTVTQRTQVPTIFGSIFGIANVTIGTSAKASITPVEGGTGMISGCWRPLLIPDTFNDADGNVWAVSGPSVSSFNGRFPPSRPPIPRFAGATTEYTAQGYAGADGDYYVSRFASNLNNSLYFKSSYQNATTSYLQPVGNVTATSIRDARSRSDVVYYPSTNVGTYRGNLMGQWIVLRPDDYRVIDFKKSNLNGDFPDEPSAQIERGCCIPLKISQNIQVTVWAPPDTPENQSKYATFHQRFANYINTINLGLQDAEAEPNRFVQSRLYPTPNANPRIIPVLLCNPLEFSNTKNIDRFTITNIGAFYVSRATSNGELIGFFVREVLTTGLPLDATTQISDKSLLPVAVNLIR